MTSLLSCTIVLGMLQGTATAQAVLAATPPMGWNSWDSYGLTITEAQYKANVDVLAARLKPFGWQYAVIDEGWYLENPASASAPETLRYRMNTNGQYEPATNRFPSADHTAGFKPLADYVHGKGLKFGIHIIRGIPKKAAEANTAIPGSSFHAADAAIETDTCPWNPDNYGVKGNAAGQAWYDALLRQYAGWGVDYIKVDCIASHPYKGDEIRMIHKAIAKTGRPIVLSLSPGPAPLSQAVELGENAQIWRISDDVWDYWEKETDNHFPQSVKDQFAVIANWAKYVRPGNWPDADMLPLGMLGPAPGYGRPRTTRLTHDEQRTLMTLWSIARSPLFFGGSLTQLDDWTAGLLTNAEVLAMNQRGHEQRLAGRDEQLVVWTAKGDEGKQWLALFNLEDNAIDFGAGLQRYGLEPGVYHVRDVWENRDLGTTMRVKGTIPAHGVLLFALER